MNRWSMCAVVGLTAVAIRGGAMPTGQGPEPPRLSAKWTKAYGNLVRSQWPSISVALSENGRCAAIAAGGALEVVDSSGEAIWRWDYLRANRYISPGAIAVSPGCDAIALVGSPSYRYTWLADRAGSRAVVPTSNTPLAAAFDASGKMVAMGTGGGDVLLLTKSGALRWKTKVRSGMPIRALSFATDNSAILLHDWYVVGAVKTNGHVLWSAFGGGMKAARDLQTFVMWEEPPHGPGIGSTAVLDGSGNELWRRFTSWTGAVVSPTGDKIVARINENQEPSEEDSLHAEEQKAPLQVLARDGRVLRRFEGIDGVPIAISPDGRRVLLHVQLQQRHALDEIDVAGHRLCTIALSGYEDTLVVAGDFSAVMVVHSGSNVEVRWYGLE